MRVYLGADIYRSANALATETDFFKGKLTYYTGDHKITAGYEQTTYDIYNVFIVAQDGAWEFDTLADYEAGIASSFDANNAKSGNVSDAAAAFEYGLTSLYLMGAGNVSNFIFRHEPFCIVIHPQRQIRL